MELSNQAAKNFNIQFLLKNILLTCFHLWRHIF